jgi:predicted transglutaminase-like cysteine proteinase
MRSSPAGRLLVTVVHDKNDKGHAVLTVTTDKGDYVLDNQNMTSCCGQRPAILSSNASRQSNPNGSR